MSQPGSSGQGPARQPVLPAQQAPQTSATSSNSRKGKRKRQPEADVDEPAAKRQLAYCPTCFERFPGFRERNEHYGTEICIVTAKQRSLRVPDTFDDLRTTRFENLEMNWSMFHTRGSAGPVRLTHPDAQALPMGNHPPVAPGHQPLPHQQPQRPSQLSQSTSFLQPASATPSRPTQWLQSSASFEGFDTITRQSHRARAPQRRRAGMSSNDPQYAQTWNTNINELPIPDSVRMFMAEERRIAGGRPAISTHVTPVLVQSQASTSANGRISAPGNEYAHMPPLLHAPMPTHTPARWKNYSPGDGGLEKIPSTSSASATTQQAALRMRAVAPPAPVVTPNAQQLEVPNPQANSSDRDDFQFHGIIIYRDTYRDFLDDVRQDKYGTPEQAVFENQVVENRDVEAGGAETAHEERVANLGDERTDATFPSDEEDAVGENEEDSDAISPADEEDAEGEEDCPTPTAGNKGVYWWPESHDAGSYQWGDSYNWAGYGLQEPMHQGGVTSRAPPEILAQLDQLVADDLQRQEEPLRGRVEVN